MNNLGAVETAVLPLATFWVIVSTLQSAATFVNTMREQVVSGGSDRRLFTLAHRRAIYLDWQLSMLGTIAAAFGFAGLVFAIAHRLEHVPGGATMEPILWVVALFPLLGGALFIVCGISDRRLMRMALESAAAHLANTMAIDPGIHFEEGS